MKEVKQAIVLVDAYRRPSRQRNTAGCYRVGAKTEKEAEELVRAAIGFGSVKFYYWKREEDDTQPKVKYKEVVKEVYNVRLANELPKATFSYEKPRHACEPLERCPSDKDEEGER